MRLQGGKNPQNSGKFQPQYGQGYTSRLTPDMSRETDIKPLQKGANTQMTLSAAQLRAIKNSPKGILPPFIKRMMRKPVMTEAEFRRMKKGK